jgi:dephospho-CoA kinase
VITHVIGVVGKIGSGKDEALRYLKSKYGVPFISTGDVVRRIAADEGRKPTRENLEEISERFFRERGEGCFVKMAGEDILRNGWKAAGISGVRSPADVSTLKAMFGRSFVLLRVDIADPKLRYGRLVRRREGRDPVTYEQFQAQDEAEERIFKTGEAGRTADFSLSNDGTIEELHHRIDELVASGQLPVA